MRLFLFTLGALTLLCLLFASCGDDGVFRPDPAAGLFDANLSPGTTGFTLKVPFAANSDELLPGPFTIRGTNVHYDEGMGALAVDITVTNHSPQTYPLPVRLRFELLRPPKMTVLNPSNGIHGVGAEIEFSFTNRDMSWNPGETSVPRNVQFGVGSGEAIGFAALILVGPPATLGVISGTVFNDLNADGIRQSEEPGVGNRVVQLAWTDSLFDCTPELDCPLIRDVLTDDEGAFYFHSLDPGFYTVLLVRDRCSTPTTPTVLQVVLVKDGDEVPPFRDADFGISLVRNCNETATAAASAKALPKTEVMPRPLGSR